MSDKGGRVKLMTCFNFFFFDFSNIGEIYIMFGYINILALGYSRIIKWTEAFEG